MEEDRKQIAQEIKIGQRVITIIKDVRTRGTVRYIGEETDSRGDTRKIVGLELVRCIFKEIGQHSNVSDETVRHPNFLRFHKKKKKTRNVFAASSLNRLLSRTSCMTSAVVALAFRESLLIILSNIVCRLKDFSN